jgi:hypothetical protein
MAAAAPTPLLPTEAIVVQLPPPEKSAFEQPKKEVCIEYHVQCAQVYPEEAPIVMPNYIEIV